VKGYDSFWSGQSTALAMLERGDFGNYERFQELLSSYQKQAERAATKLGATECAIQPVRK